MLHILPEKKCSSFIKTQINRLDQENTLGCCDLDSEKTMQTESSEERFTQKTQMSLLFSALPTVVGMKELLSYCDGTRFSRKRTIFSRRFAKTCHISFTRQFHSHDRPRFVHDTATVSFTRHHASFTTPLHSHDRPASLPPDLSSSALPLHCSNKTLFLIKIASSFRGHQHDPSMWSVEQNRM